MNLTPRDRYATARRIADKHNYYHHDNDQEAEPVQLPREEDGPYYYSVTCPICPNPDLPNSDSRPTEIRCCRSQPLPPSRPTIGAGEEH